MSIGWSNGDWYVKRRPCCLLHGLWRLEDKEFFLPFAFSAVQSGILKLYRIRAKAP